MSYADLTQHEADRLISIRKMAQEDEKYSFPSEGESCSIPIVSLDRQEQFLLDIHQSRITLTKITSQLRVKNSCILLRVDTGSRWHTNPDGTVIQGPHIHRYREGHGDAFAEELPKHIFTNPDDTWNTFCEFMYYCNIIPEPNVERRIDQWSA
jgi:hypothetical protein